MLDDRTSPARTAAEKLNRDCQCATLDAPRLARALAEALGEGSDIKATHPHLFASAPVFLPQPDLKAMAELVREIENAAETQAYRALALAQASEADLPDHGPHGVFMGYDFHLSADGPKLIEINTNAGGPLLNAYLAEAQLACCAPIERALNGFALRDFEADVMAMFEAEWRAQRGDRPLKRIAIVDSAPREQYLFPEFVLARNLFQRFGFEAEIVDGGALVFDGQELSADGKSIDLVYNRLIDFAFADPAHAPLREAWLGGAVVVTPSPRHHALMADKRNLVHLANPALGLVPLSARSALPGALVVTAANAEELWSERKRYFFKPADGYASKGVYRGDKLTRRTWNEIVSGRYIAQTYVPPSERFIRVGDEVMARKVDIRLYTYRGSMLLAAARLYQGQTTNFRTPGGGFAPVFFL